MKVLMLNGSPNAKGCAFTALSEVEKALNQCGVETEIMHIGKKPVRGCIGCKGCAGKGRCVFGDDLVNTALDKAAEADGLVLGSPVYYASANGAFSAFLDRFFYAADFMAYKVGAAVVSARRAGTTAALDQLNKYFLISSMPLVSTDYWPMVHGNTPEEVKQDLEGMQMMNILGQNMAWLLKCMEAGKAAGIEVPGREKRERTNFIR